MVFQRAEVVRSVLIGFVKSHFTLISDISRVPNVIYRAQCLKLLKWAPLLAGYKQVQKLRRQWRSLHSKMSPFAVCVCLVQTETIEGAIKFDSDYVQVSMIPAATPGNAG